MIYDLQRYELRRLRLIASEVGAGPVLDIGHAQKPNLYLDAEVCTGFDLDRSADCAYAEQVQGDVREITTLLDGKRFGTVVAAEFIEHVENPYAFLRDLRRLIAPGGRLIISTPNPVGFPTLLLEWAQSRRFFYTSQHTYYFAPRWMVRVLEHSGYRVTKVRGVGLWPGAFIPVPASLSYQVIYVAAPAGEPDRDA